MKRESAWRKKASRLLVLVLSITVLLSFCFMNVSLADDDNSSSTSVQTDRTDTPTMQVGVQDAYVGHVPSNKSFAYIESRYYDGTNYVKIFNMGFFMGISNQYYVNGDWTNMEKIAHREDYTADEACTAYTNDASPGQVPRPENYPANDVGGDADGYLASYNAGIYTTTAWDNFSMFGRKASINYVTSSVTKGAKISTYVEIWKVDPEISLKIDKESLKAGDTFTASLTISNTYNNDDGLPKADEVEFTADSATQTSNTVKNGNVYTAAFKVNSNASGTVKLTAGVGDKATNYNSKYVSQEYKLTADTPVTPVEPVTPVTPVNPPAPAEEHTVTFHPENGQPTFTQTVPDGGQAVQPDDPTNDGYKFDGWYTDTGLTKQYDFSAKVTGDLDLYAKWTRVTETVKPTKPAVKKVTGILLPKVIAKGKHTQTLTWTALTNVDGYFIYTNHCDEGKKLHPFKKVADYKASKARVYTKKNLKTYHNYKYYVAAYKIKNGKKVIVRNSVTVHSVCGNTSARSTNVKSVKAKKHAVTLKKGQSYTLKASISKISKNRAFLDTTHCGLIRYLVKDSKIATVDYNTGKIKAKKAGKTTVYVLGVNGIRDKCVVTVK